MICMNRGPHSVSFAGKSRRWNMRPFEVPPRMKTAGIFSCVMGASSFYSDKASFENCSAPKPRNSLPSPEGDLSGWYMNPG